MDKNALFSLLQTQKSFFIPLGIGVFLVGCVFVFLFSLFSTSQQPSTDPLAGITPPVANNNLTISSVSPSHNTPAVGIFQIISITFSRPLSSSEKSLVSLQFSPEVVGKKMWAPDQRTLSFTPSKPFLQSQPYIATISYFGEKYSWRFTTIPAESVSTQDQMKLQTEADKDYAEKTQRIEETYPWLKSLPLQEENYFVYFDQDKKQIVALLYPKTTSQTSISQQEQTVKNEINTRLRSLGIDEEKYPPLWISKPEP